MKQHAPKLKHSYQNFEETFRVLLDKAKAGPVSIEVFLNILSGRGKILLLIFLSLGFGQIPGIAILFGLFITYLGIRIAIGKSFIWLPKKLRRKKIPSYFLIKVIKQLLGFLKFMKKWSYPRYVWTTQTTRMRIINGLMISLVGLSFALSPPVPFSGWIAVFAIFLIAIGLLNDDGVYIFVGHAAAVFYFITVLLLMNFCSLGKMIHWAKCGVSYLCN